MERNREGRHFTWLQPTDLLVRNAPPPGSLRDGGRSLFFDLTDFFFCSVIARSFDDVKLPISHFLPGPVVMLIICGFATNDQKEVVQQTQLTER